MLQSRALQDHFWPCEIVFCLAEVIFGLAGLFLSLQDRFWPCEIVYALVRQLMVLQDHFWPCEIIFGLAEIVFGLARSFLALPTVTHALRLSKS